MNPVSGRGGGRGIFQKSQGDWPCPNPGCNNINFARRTACNRCHTPRQEELTRNSENVDDKEQLNDFRGPPGLFKPGDWTCTICANVNWERRLECNICKNPKPGLSGLDEKRDGVAGGFNERQERVASGKAEIGEDGYDDFGMRKKKVKASKAEREAAALARLQQSYCAIYRLEDEGRVIANQNGDEGRETIRSHQRSLSPSRRLRERSKSRSRTRLEERDGGRRQHGRRGMEQNKRSDGRYRDRVRKL